jgi:hypothetical protein
LVHINNPPLMMARHSGRNMPATNPNSRAVAPLRPRARSVKRIIAAAPKLLDGSRDLPGGCTVASVAESYKWPRQSDRCPVSLQGNCLCT